MVGVYTIYGSSDIEISGETKVYDLWGWQWNANSFTFLSRMWNSYTCYADAFDGFMFLPIGAFDNREFLPRIEYFRNYGLDWLTNNGCIEESLGEAAVVERMQALMENLIKEQLKKSQKDALIKEKFLLPI